MLRLLFGGKFALKCIQTSVPIVLMFHLKQSLRDRYFSEDSPGLILMKTHSNVRWLLHAYRWNDRQNLMGDPQRKMRLQVLLFAYSKYSCVSYALRRWMKIFHNHPCQGERMSGISDNRNLILRPNSLRFSLFTVAWLITFMDQVIFISSR